MKDQLNENGFESQDLPPFGFDAEFAEDNLMGGTSKKDKQAYAMRRSIEDRLEEKRLQDLISDWECDDGEELNS